MCGGSSSLSSALTGFSSSAQCEFLSDLIGHDATLTTATENSTTHALITIDVTDVTAVCNGILYATGPDSGLATFDLSNFLSVEIA